MVAKDQPGCCGVAARLPKNPGTQKLTPPSSAREISGASAKVATATAQPTRRTFDSMDAIAKLHAVSQCRQLKQAARPLKLRCARQIDRATLDSRPHAAPKIRDTSVTAEVFEHHKREAVCGQAPTLRLAGSVQKYLMSATLPQFLES